MAFFFFGIMSTIVNPQMKPQIVTLAQLQRTLLPLVVGYKWGTDTIWDLWQSSTPIPQPANEPEKRIVLPVRFLAWWADVQQRMGIATPGETIYARTSATPHSRAQAAVTAWNQGNGNKTTFSK